MRRSYRYIVATLFWVAFQTSAQSNLAVFRSQTGDPAGLGQSYVTTNDTEIALSGTPAAISVAACGFQVHFTGPGGAVLTVGTYTNAVRWEGNGAQPGLGVEGPNAVCQAVCGSFILRELHTDAQGQVDRLWVAFTHRCECAEAGMNGEIRFHSLLAPANPTPRTIRVPADFATIQGGIDDANPLGMDTVLVSPGLYREEVNFKGKPVTVVSSAGPEATFINPSRTAFAVSFRSGETTNSVLSGFTLTNAMRGCVAYSASPTVVSNTFTECDLGLGCEAGSPVVRHNRFVANGSLAASFTAEGAARFEDNLVRGNRFGGILISGSSPAIRRNRIQENAGEGIAVVNYSSPLIEQNLVVSNAQNGITWTVPPGERGPYLVNNTIVRNGAGGVLAGGYSAQTRILNNIIWGAPALVVTSFDEPSLPQVLCNDVFSPNGLAYDGLIADLTGTAGNISVDPWFACLPEGEFHLLAGSACIDAGTDDLSELSDRDLGGGARVLAGNPSRSARVDIGAYEFNLASPPAPCLYVECPSNIVVVLTNGQASAVVAYPAPMGTPVAHIASSPPSGSAFPEGTNVVTCTATYDGASVQGTFTITVRVAPTIRWLSSSTNVAAGQAVHLSVTPGPGEPFTYHWLFETNLVAGATGPTLTIENVQAAQEGVYRVAIANGVASIVSPPIAVRVLPAAPRIVNPPVSLTLGASSNGYFTVTAVGSQPLEYQWLFQGTPLAGALGPSYLVAGVQATHAGEYQVVVHNAMGAVTSQVATLTVTPRAPYFVVQPVGGTAAAGSGRTLIGVAAGSEPIAYQWFRNDLPLAGARQSMLVLSNLSLADSAAYALSASNAAGVSGSAVAQLTVDRNPMLLRALTHQAVEVGDTVALTVEASGATPFTYAWQYNGQPLDTPGPTPTLTLSPARRADTGFYTVTVANDSGSVSSTGRLSVLPRPGRVVAWGDDSGRQTEVPADLSDAVAIAGGDYHSVALGRNGQLFAWGYGAEGQTAVPLRSQRYVDVTAGAAHNLAITDAGDVVAWGRNEAGQCNVPANLGGAVLATAAGDAHSLALLASGAVVAWGDNSFGQTAHAARMTQVIAIGAGRNHSLAIRYNGVIVGWGLNSHRQASPPVVFNAVAVAGGYLHSAALLADGTVMVWGDNSAGQLNLPEGLSNVVAIAAGDFHTLALRADGTVLAWGGDSFGQSQPPVALAGVTRIAAGNYHSLAVVSGLSRLGIARLSQGVVVRWTGSGTLQGAATPRGPYSDLSAPGTAYTNLDLTAPARFYRLRE